MKQCMRRLRHVTLGLAVGLCVIAAAPPASSAARGVAPITSQPQGRSYGEWGARWWQWALATPANINPFAGADCQGGQTGHVWFLGGVFGGGEIERTCRMPTGTALFFPIINNAYAAFLNDPADTRTEAYVREAARCVATVVSASVDGAAIDQVARYYVDAQDSPLFDIQLPVDNILGLTEEDAEQLLLSPVAHSGYYLFVAPLPPGTHTLEWHASGECGAQTVSYTLEVVAGAMP
jgi:hypothetical protein